MLWYAEGISQAACSNELATSWLSRSPALLTGKDRRPSNRPAYSLPPVGMTRKEYFTDLADRSYAVGSRIQGWRGKPDGVADDRRLGRPN